MVSLAQIVSLDEVADDVFTGPNEEDRGFGRLFGGQVLAQALRAAAHTVAADRLPHSCHAYFLRPGKPDEPVMLHVHRDRDGGSFSARHIVASQGDAEIFTMSASFHVREESGKLEVPIRPDVPDPDTLEPVSWFRAVADLVVLRPEPGPDGVWSGPPTRMWTRAAQPLGDDPVDHACALAYVSDIGVGFGDTQLEGLERGGPTIDHALWFQAPIRLDDWVLLDLTPWKAGGARGLYTGTIHDRAGTLGATLAQEVLLRVRDDRPPPWVRAREVLERERTQEP
jgi:acyl-CoA thioesterase II